MIPPEAIKKAVEGGWTQRRAHYEKHEHQSEVALDLSFWKALVKALGWDKIDGSLHEPSYEYNWQYCAYEFFDLIISGGDTEAFWEELLTNHQTA